MLWQFLRVFHLELLKVAKTIFVLHYILLKRLVSCREALQTTVIQRTWKDLLKNLDEGKRNLATLVQNTMQEIIFGNMLRHYRFHKANLFGGKFS